MLTATIARRTAIWIGVARRVCIAIVDKEIDETKNAASAGIRFPVNNASSLESARTVERIKDCRLSRTFRKVPKKTNKKIGTKDNADQGEKGYDIRQRAMERPVNKVIEKQLFIGR